MLGFTIGLSAGCFFTFLIMCCLIIDKDDKNNR